MGRGRPLKNRSNYWSQHHYGMLVVLAKQVLDQFDGKLDINELINVGWFRQARYYKSVVGKARRVKREMYNWAVKERKSVLESFDECWENVYRKW